jgi:hypothetical protein
MTAARPVPPTTPADAAQRTRPDVITNLTTAPAERLRPARFHRASAGAAESRSARRRVASAAGAVVVSVGAALAVPVPAAAAPAPCEQAQTYAAESGIQFIRLNRLDLRPIGGDGDPTTDAGLGEARSALIADATINAAAVGRMVDAAGAGRLGAPLIQSAPPTHKQPARRTTTRGEIGPFALGSGVLSAHARWDPRMACGRRAGEVTRAEAVLGQVGIGGELVRVPEKVTSLSTTALDKGARTVATAGFTARGFDLLNGTVHVRVVRPPALLASVSTTGGGEIRYVPAVLEVSGDGLETTTLDTAGDDVELTLGDDMNTPDTKGATDPATDNGVTPDKPGTHRDAEATTLGDLLSGLPTLDGLTKGSPLPVPAVPGLPSVGSGDAESAQVTGPGTRLRITLGDVRQATAGQSIAAKATAIKIEITQGPPTGRDKPGYGHTRPTSSGVVLDLDVGVLEAAAAAPESPGGGVQAVTVGGGGGLPITGPRVDGLAVAGGALLIGGVAALTFGLRRRRFRP